MRKWPRFLAAAALSYAFVVLLPAPLFAAGEIPATEFQARRRYAVEHLPDGILLLHARSSVASQDQHGFLQEPNFYYFTGLENILSAILAIDGRARESWLFVPSKLSGFAGRQQRHFVKVDTEAAAKLAIEHVVDWSEFAPYLDRRLAADPTLVLYMEKNGNLLRHESNPPGIAPVQNHVLLWRQGLESRWPKVTIRSDPDFIDEMRSVKSPAEIEMMRRAAKASAAALLAGLSDLKADRRQRNVEAQIANECVQSGADGVSFWPWVMTGPNAVFPAPFESFVDYRHLDRHMGTGELARVDVGCEVDHYQGDVGRTAPVSARFDPGQRETWELLVSAYRAGLAVMRDGVAIADVRAAFLRQVEQQRERLKTPMGKQAAAMILSKNGIPFWQIHGMGLDSEMVPGRVLKAGMVVCLEPMFTVEGQGFFLEDMILIKRDGSEILTTGLPYSALEIERAVGKRRFP